MGLDMYLLRKTYVKNWDHDSSENKYHIAVTKNGNPTNINSSKITEITEEFGYWRKANAIHKWFVDNVQGGNDDCGSYHVNLDKIQQLLALCKSVIENNNNANCMLPTNTGYFFGGTEYSDHYKQYIQYTIEVLEEALTLIQNGGNNSSSFYYHSSW